MDATEGCESRRIETLRAEGDARNARAAVLAEYAALDRARVCFQRDLGIRREPQLRTRALEHAADGARREQARGPAAEEHRAHLAAADRGRLRGKIARETLHIGLFGEFPVQRVGVEIAVRALAHAPGKVHVERQRRGGERGHGRWCAPQRSSSRNLTIHSFTSRGRSICIMCPASESMATPRTSLYCCCSAPSGSSPCQASRSQSRSLPMK